ncbi:MAG: hypothetical protein LCI03_10940 [Actinobacteria bacterium]|nr:hypothetical protein [Actinomycetota bacterium]
MHAEWSVVLDGLERDLEALEAALAGGSPETVATLGSLSSAWEAPVVPTRIPAHLVPRAVDLLTRQDDALARIAEATSSLRSQIDLVTTAASGTDRNPPPVFLDQAL